ncbi:MAG: radical SAM protein [Vicinamibacteria bacterium]
MDRSIYLVQPSYRDRSGTLLKGRRQGLHSAVLPALSAAVPPDWRKRSCIEYFEDVDFDCDASVVGITSMGYDFPRGRELAAEFRRRGKVVLFGGWPAGLSPEKLSGLCDALVTGNPGPKALGGILADAERGRLAPEYRCGVEIDYPWDYSVFDGKRIDYPPVVTGVGCPNRCAFCCIAATYRGRYTPRAIDCVVADVRSAAARSRTVSFVDSNLYGDRAYLLRLCEAMSAEAVRVRWGAQATIAVGADEAALRALRAAGCRMLFIGMETLDQANLRSVGKPYAVADYRDRVARIQDAGIAVAGYFILGLDGDDPGTFDRLYDFVRRTGINLPILNVLLPASGTALHERLRKEGRLLIEDEDEMLANNAGYNSSARRCFFVPKGMTPRQVEEGYLALSLRLTTPWLTLRRSLHRDPVITAALLAMNLDLRRKTALQARADRDEQAALAARATPSSVN